MKKPIIIILAALLALPATAWVGEVFSSREGGTLLYYTIIDEDANTCITSPGTDEDDPGNSVRKSLVIPEKVTYDREEYTVVGIGDYGFSGARETVEIPSTVTSIGKYAFYHCDNLTEVILPSGLESIGDYAFHYCRYLVRAGIAGEEKSVLPPSLTYLGKGAFDTCWNLAAVVIPGSVKEINVNAFNECHDLATVELGDGISCIWQYAFHKCNSLVSLTVPEGVTHIYPSAFYECKGLEKISLPASLTYLGYDAFNGSPALTEVKVAAMTPPTLSSNTFTDENNVNATLLVPGSSVRAYQAADYWMDFLKIRAIDGDDPAPLTLTIDGETEPLKTGLDYELTGNMLVMWKSSNIKVATVDADGVVTAVGPGTATITALVPGYTDLKKTCQVTVSRDEATGTLSLHESAAE